MRPSRAARSELLRRLDVEFVPERLAPASVRGRERASSSVIAGGISWRRRSSRSQLPVRTISRILPARSAPMPGNPASVSPRSIICLHVAPQFADRARRIAVGADAKRIGVLDLEPVGDLLESGGDVQVLDGH